MTCLSPKAIVLPEPELLQRPMSGFTALSQPQSVLVFVTPVNNEGLESRTTELTPSLSDYNTRDHWPYPSQAIRTDSVGGSTVELAIRT